MRRVLRVAGSSLAPADKKTPGGKSARRERFEPSGVSAELVHRVVRAAGLQRGFAGEVFLVVVADVRARHVLVLHAGDALADLLALHAL